MHSVAHTPFMHSLGSPAVSAALGAFALLGPGRKLLVDGALSLYRGNPNMNSLIGLGAATSFAAGAASTLIPGMGLEVSFLEEPVMLLAVVLLGRTLEARARLKASADLHTLAKLIPEKSRLVLDPGSPPGQQGAVSGAGVELVQVPTASIRAGDVIRVLPGERIPVDGQILEGRCSVDESMLTGESALVPKASGAKVTAGTVNYEGPITLRATSTGSDSTLAGIGRLVVTAGTVNYEGPITLRATSTGSDSTLAGIGRLVADAQAREAPVQRLADAVAGKFCYGVMAASAATFGFWAAAGANLFPQALHAIAVSGPNAPVLLGLKLAVDVLVVACPCALGLATPTAVLVASSVGAKRGLLLRGGDVLERIASVNVVVFDKTGTLTQGRMQLVGSQLLSGRLSESEVLRLAAGVEASTRHPLADALLKAAKAQGVQVPHTEGASTEPGQGVSQTVVYVGAEGDGVIGAYRFSDTLRGETPEVVAQLRGMGLRVMMLSGDNQAAVNAIAGQAGIAGDSAWGEMRPEQKAAVIQQLRQAGNKVAMVGDGVNDAPALAAADVGIALSGGMDAAGEAASVVLMGDRLGQVVEAITLGRSTLGKIKQNLAWALVYNLWSPAQAAIASTGGHFRLVPGRCLT
ncbi:hypothetical protein WJX72_007735 [[Myrmecia] bisecta]|uniref:P-type ATPase A domain-containing protein n=1 Tax=[Myrmecia] bisecta TaxID=41462 RepID=A0AAW1P7A3_9CHLO